jgi:hypothetical protein
VRIGERGVIITSIAKKKYESNIMKKIRSRQRKGGIGAGQRKLRSGSEEDRW